MGSVRKIKMGRVADLSPGKMIEKMILGRRVAIVQYDGRLYGIESECKHMRSSLAKGQIVDGIVTCPWHGWRFNIETGDCLTVEHSKLKRYSVEVKDGDLFLLM